MAATFDSDYSKLLCLEKPGWTDEGLRAAKGGGGALWEGWGVGRDTGSHGDTGTGRAQQPLERGQLRKG